jgi:hypothetical protein
MPNPTSSDTFVPVIDVSRHQGSIDFGVMRSKGVRGLILRASHGSTRDDRVERYYHDAVAAGFDPQEVGFYSFINPKRGTAAETANATVQIIDDVTGGRDGVLYMLDVENYKDEPPDVGSSPLSGAVQSVYLQEHRAEFQRLMPNCFVIAYTNRAYWDSALGPRDPVHAAELEWIVPRYPLYSFAAYERHGVPPEPAQWSEFAFRIKSEGPISPAGAVWSGWQFSAGFNKQGEVYGCESRDLDLNVVLESAWNRWTQRSGPGNTTTTPGGIFDMTAFRMRWFDTRPSKGGDGKIAADAAYIPELPPDAGNPSQVLLNVQTVEGDAPGGYLKVYTATDTGSSENVIVPGVVSHNLVLVAVGADRKVVFKPSVSTNLVVDIQAV